MFEISAEEFVRRLKMNAEKPDSRYALFLGSGCSVSSGIPTSKNLVQNWLMKLKELRTGTTENLGEWIKSEFPDYTSENASKYYGSIIEKLFHTSQERQNEVERLTSEKDPGFGYACLAKIISHEKFGRKFNIVLTTNFDDLVADALYLYTNTKPLVIIHESLVGFVRISRTRPLVIKLHGDARLSPKNTILETDVFNENVKKVFKNILRETGLVFMGYNGYDKSIVNVLEELDPDALPWGIYWVNDTKPDGPMGDWLEKRNAIWVKHRDFDELMLLFRNELDLEHPTGERFDRLLNTYTETFQNLQRKVSNMPENNEKDKLEEALKNAISTNDSISLMFRAILLATNDDLQNASKTWSEILEKYPESPIIVYNFANFLNQYKRDYKQAEQFYQKAIRMDPKNDVYLAVYAAFVSKRLKQHTTAEEMLKKAMEINPLSPTALACYAVFLEHIKNNYVEAEKYHRLALERIPSDDIVYANFASFLNRIGKFEEAKPYYERAKQIGFSGSMSDLLYADSLLTAGKYDNGIMLLKSITNRMTQKHTMLVHRFLLYAHDKNENVRMESLIEIKKLIQQGIRQVNYYNASLDRAIKDGHPQPELLKNLLEVIYDEKDENSLNDFDDWKALKT